MLVESNQTLLRHPQPPLWASQQRPLLVTFSITIELQLNSIAQELIFGYRGKQNKHTQKKKHEKQILKKWQNDLNKNMILKLGHYSIGLE